jgi:hypothetical protein
MPVGFEDLEEAQLPQAPRILAPELGRQLSEWWLPTDRQEAKTPNFDIASTCSVDGRPGLLLVEAKAHDQELIKEASGRRLGADSPEERKASHGPIGDAINLAREGFEQATGLKWRISRDSHYQMSNRFAWSWKLTQLGIPVVLVYLGFLNAHDMESNGRRPFSDYESWATLVRSHSDALFPSEVWDRVWWHRPVLS